MICCDRFFIFLSLATLAPHQPFQNRTILYLALNLSPLSKVRCCRPKEFGRLPEGLPQLHRPSPSPQPLQKDNSTMLCTKLASLVKGRWLDGTTQTVALLRPTCDMSALFILQTFQPSRRRDCLSCIDPLHPHNHCKKTIVPCSALNSPPLSNGGAVTRKNSGDYRRDCHTNLSLRTNLPKTALSFENRQHPCLPCQREVA